jgi:hypothetical protein
MRDGCPRLDPGDCLDHVVVLGEQHLRNLLCCYATYYNQAQTHLSLGRDAPSPRKVYFNGRILPVPFLAGLHHHIRIMTATGARDGWRSRTKLAGFSPRGEAEQPVLLSR